MSFTTLFLVFSICHFARALPLFSTNQIDSIFSFGNSYSDTGNYVVLSSSILDDPPGSTLPYGETFFHRPTGRTSDGRLVLDFIAEELGLPFVPPYLPQNDSFTYGANFAVGGATALDLAFAEQNNLTNPFTLNSSLDVQLNWFDELLPSLCNSPDECRQFLGRSLFVLGEIGGNDYAYMVGFGWSVAKAITYVPKVVNTISLAIERLINKGARIIVIPGTWPAGCTPFNLAVNMDDSLDAYEPETHCLKDLNELSRIHNKQLHMEIRRLRLIYPRIHLIYTEYYTPVIDFILSPGRFGFIGTPLRACCGKGDNQYNMNLMYMCGTPNATACEDPSTYVSWDGTHLTEAAYKYIASGWLRGPHADPPIFHALHEFSAMNDFVGFN